MQTTAPDQLIAKKDWQLREQVSPRVKKKWFWMGCIEMLPIAISFFLFKQLPSFLFTYDYLLIGMLSALFLIWIFRNKVPQPPIHIQTDKNTFNFYTPPIH